MVKYYCDRCEKELKENELYSRIKFEHFEFHEAGGLPVNEFLNIKQILCKDCTNNIRNYILLKPLRYNSFLGEYTKGEKING